VEIIKIGVIVITPGNDEVIWALWEFITKDGLEEVIRGELSVGWVVEA
jgi:hypothetical protein